MTIDLSDYEAGDPFDGDYEAELAKLQKRLSHIQTAHIIHKRRAIIALEGWDAAGKGGVIKRLTAEWDPRYYEVWPISAPTQEELAHHFLWRFWQRLPAQHNIAVFDRTWYGRVLVERVEGYASETDWRRGYGEINDFEAQQVNNGATLIKIFLHVTQKTQDKRLRDRLTHCWKRWKTGLDDFRNRARRADYLDAMHEMFHETDTPQARWTVIDGNNKKAARIAALTAIAEQLETHVPMVPPALDAEVVKVATEALGKF
ncbi:polyphosphate kinase 2 family protein [Sphingomonas sp. R1]|uniref:polyphosphate kinase 2 family protein n=1 Tax=Sphingomonas sp. R1 TaxID=399176 RepID=UPI00222422FA|nr:polyphosphate kinase [Sphingomonas sp. R1]UYY78018.1 polyphosphate kinase [Sphingomonas sp. R1]